MSSYFIEIESCDGCADYQFSTVKNCTGMCFFDRTPRTVDEYGKVPDWCPRNAQPAEYVQKLEKGQAEFGELKALYLDALENNELLEAEMQTLESEYRQVLVKLPKGD